MLGNVILRGRPRCCISSCVITIAAESTSPHSTHTSSPSRVVTNESMPLQSLQDPCKWRCGKIFTCTVPDCQCRSSSDPSGNGEDRSGSSRRTNRIKRTG
eukprot:TRINITY_DN5174_c0_g2_i3.p2 TRINITY_DN5174_c0_g2~~TRINITY_DN5174_c0_g2_i3.p2  ORF type:complete len:100 (-),score=1.95 TRINITY_DN5174_c0_g2_i3:364-663(-)